jgi:hypothetical protein
MQTLSETESVQKRGYVMIKNLKGMDLYLHFDRIIAKKALGIMRDAMPVEMKAYHMCIGSGQSVSHLGLPVIKHIAGKDLRLHMVTHAGSDKDLLAEIEVYGLHRPNVSSVIGGTFTHSLYTTWLQQRAEFEQKRQQE